MNLGIVLREQDRIGTSQLTGLVELWKTAADRGCRSSSVVQACGAFARHDGVQDRVRDRRSGPDKALSGVDSLYSIVQMAGGFSGRGPMAQSVRPVPPTRADAAGILAAAGPAAWRVLILAAMR